MASHMNIPFLLLIQMHILWESLGIVVAQLVLHGLVHLIYMPTIFLCVYAGHNCNRMA